MKQKFYKYQGTGNDFVMIDDRDQKFPIEQPLIAQLCDRRFGIGADGLILIQKAEKYDFKMVYFNADGNEGSMCGNGGRCAVRFAEFLGLFKQKTTFIAVDGEHEATTNDNEIALKMLDVQQIEKEDGYDFINTGSPHYVTFKDNNSLVDVVSEGRTVRYSPEFEGGTNVNFVQILNQNTINVRTYERGVEDETFSCGTGVTAAAISTFLRYNTANELNITTKGGRLKVSFEYDKAANAFKNIYLTGPAIQVFEGEI